MAFYAGGHVCQCLSRLLTLRRDYTVMVSGDRRLSGQQFVTEVLGLAHGLRQLGLGSGDVVAISALNRDLYLEWLLAVTFVGGIVAPLNYRWSFGEARSAMEVVRPVMLVTDGSCGYWFTELRDNAMSSIRWHVSMCLESKLSGAQNVLTTGEITKPSSTSLSFNYLWAPQCIALICFTSGTTGRPKGVKISHSALIVQSLAKIAIVGYGDDDVYLHTAPLCHIGGISSAMAMLMAGGCHIIIPKFEAKIACDSIEQHRVTSLITVPAMMVDLISVIREKKTWSGKHSVKKILNGGGSLSSQIIHEATHFFPKSKLITAYGMTEACSSLTFMTLWNPSREPCDQSPQMSKTNSSSIHQSEGVCVGKPAPHVELKIDVEEPSPIGKIMTRGPHMMLGYWDQNSADISVPCKMGWLDTGDIGKIDHNGNVWLIGRANGRIKSGGENVYPEEVEAVISQHPGVSGIVVVGALDARLTEMVVACVSLKDDWHWTDHCSVISKHHPCLLSSDILRQYCKEKNLSGFKIPKIFVAWRKPFPFTMSGKLRRDQVKTEVASILRLLPCNL